jgi:hypothetical protein
VVKLVVAAKLVVVMLVMVWWWAVKSFAVVAGEMEWW